MEFAELITAYSEIGILGLCAIMMIYMFYKNFKNNQDATEKKDKKIDHKDKFTENSYTELLKMIQEQNKQFQEQQMKNNEILIEAITHNITTHVPSKEEDEKISKISLEIDKCLAEILEATNASRVGLVQYHNGGKGINRQAFLKMSMTNEQIKPGIKPMMSTFRDQFRSILAYAIKELMVNDVCCIDDVNDLIEKDSCMYEFMRAHGVEAGYGIGIRSSEGTGLGFICVQFVSKTDANKDNIIKVFNEKAKIIETLLNL